MQYLPMMLFVSVNLWRVTLLNHIDRFLEEQIIHMKLILQFNCLIHGAMTRDLSLKWSCERHERLAKGLRKTYATFV